MEICEETLFDLLFKKVRLENEEAKIFLREILFAI